MSPICAKVKPKLSRKIGYMAGITDWIMSFSRWQNALSQSRVGCFRLERRVSLEFVQQAFHRLSVRFADRPRGQSGRKDSNFYPTPAPPACPSARPPHLLDRYAEGVIPVCCLKYLPKNDWFEKFR